MKVIFDFDDVVFKAKEFKEVIFSVLEKKGYENVRTKYEEVRNSKNPFSLYFFIKLVTFDSSEINVDNLYEEIMSKCPEMINEEILELITSLGKENCYIVSNGDTEFQMDKIRKSIGEYHFQEIVVVPGSKAESIVRFCEQHKDEDVIFVDDRLHFINDLHFDKCQNLKTVFYNENGHANLRAEIEDSLTYEARKRGMPDPQERAHKEQGRIPTNAPPFGMPGMH